MEDYVDLFKYRSSRYVSAEGQQFELPTKLFDECSRTNRTRRNALGDVCMSHNEVLVNLHPDMVVGIIVPEGTATDVKHVLKAFPLAFGRPLPVITRLNNFFYVRA